MTSVERKTAEAEGYMQWEPDLSDHEDGACLTYAGESDGGLWLLDSTFPNATIRDRLQPIIAAAIAAAMASDATLLQALKA